MGSLIDGRGRWYRWSKKSLVTDYRQLTISKVAKELDLEQHKWASWAWWNGETKTASIDIEILPGQGLRLHYSVNKEPVTPYLVPIVTTPPKFGGVRYWFLCPNLHCHRRCAILYGGRLFLCRKCHDLTYETVQKGGDLTTSIDNRIRAIRRRLGAKGGLFDSLPDKPEGMSHKTYWRLVAEYQALIDLYHTAWAVDLNRIFKPGAFLDGDIYNLLEDVSEDVEKQWKELKRDRKTGEHAISRFSRQLAADLPDYEKDTEGHNWNRLTMGELATAAGVPFDFAKEALHEGLIRADQGRTTRRKRYRERLKNWLRKLHTLREAGISWEEIRAWTKRRWQPGHEHERSWPH